MVDAAPAGIPGWMALLAIVAMLLPPLLAGLDLTAPAVGMEKLCLASSQETWLLGAKGGEPAWLIPSLYGRPRVHKPPLTTWGNLLAWRDLDPATAAPESIVLRSRLAAVAAGLMLLLGTYWIGRLLANPRFAVVATLVTSTQFLFIRQARTATYDIQLAAWVTLSVAAGLWAIRLTQERRRGRWAGWALSGLCLGGAVLTKGPLAYAWVFAPLGLFLLTNPESRARVIAGLGAVLLVGTLLAAPWYIYVLGHVPLAAQRLLHEYAAEHYKATPPWYYVQLLVLALPWTLWLVRGLAEPFGRPASGKSRELLFLCCWFGLAVLVLSIPDLKAPRYLAPLLPVAGLIAAHALLNLPEEGGKWIEPAHWRLLLFVSLALPLYLSAEGLLVKRGILKDILCHGLSPSMVVLCGLWPLAVLALAWACRRRYPGRLVCVVATALWVAGLATAGNALYDRRPAALARHRPAAERIALTVGNDRLFYVWEQPGTDTPPGVELLFYLRRVAYHADFETLQAEAAGGKRFYVITRGARDRDQVLQKMGLERAMDFSDDRSGFRRLYRAGHHPGKGS